MIRANSCPDGHYVMVERSEDGGANKVNIWRLNADGSNPKQLTNGNSDIAARCTRDGKWVYYQDWFTDLIMRVPMDGGKPEAVPGAAIPNTIFAQPGMAISPDGKTMTFLVVQIEKDGPIYKLAFVPLDAGPTPSVQLVDPDPRVSENPEFTPDGSAVIYPIREHGVENLWLQPLDGSRGRQITHFESDQIQALHFSPDGKTLGVFRQHIESDVVLLQDTSTVPQ